jgi:predicted esterase
MAADFIHRYVPGSLPFTVLALHETGGDENDLLPVARALFPGAAILSPRLGNDGLAEWIVAAAAKYELDPTRVYALGYSTGANAAVSVMLGYPGLIAGGVLLRPTNVTAPEPLPDLNASPILIVAGQHDITIPPRESERIARLLTEAGAQVDFAVNDANHHLTPQDFSLGKKWFAQLTAA